MGRELKRVALDFEWELQKAWKGFINPHYKACSNLQCDGGQLAIGWFVQGVCYKLFHAGQDAFHKQKPHPWTLELPTSGECFPNGELPEGLDVLIAGLMGLKPEGAFPERPGLFSSGGVPDYTLMRKLFELAGLSEDFYTCKVCDGEGLHLDAKEAYDAWEEFEPPKGIGYQVWETVSEGSPVSPVFAKPEVLASWMVDNDTSITSDTGYEGWMKFITEDQWAPSAMVSPGTGFQSGVKAQEDL